ncbi:MAG TPA: ATP-binding protein, partial [Saprospiraceae bacterium]|nr:ATP-binding protein [Saprospiraceae bacterium]
PLNFVNNFSEVSAELLEELKDEIASGNLDEVKSIASDVKQNLEKILHHGQRADAIVKGMLQHSRTSSGKKEPTDLNALADEYLRLAYHGFRAKDKSFNVNMKTDLDPALPKINVVPQDIGRVLLNLITNAFQAVSALKSPEGDFRTPGGVREPTVIVSTKQWKSPVAELSNKDERKQVEASGDLGAEIRVSDNGPGIPKDVLDKIFQPFFTTKPVGEGTGLGLSISYDIIKAHGGQFNVETKEGEGTSFIIQLPMA